MGILTFADFEDEILAALGNRTEQQSVTATRMTRALNLAQERVNRAHPFFEMRQVAYAQMNFTGDTRVDKFLIPPPRTRTISSFVLLDTSAGISSLGQSRKVVGKPWRWFDHHYPAPEWLPPGYPSYYAQWGEFLVMAPAPYLQMTAQLRYVEKPLPFVAAEPTQVSQYDDKDDILLNYSLAFFFRSLGRNDRANYFEGLAQEMLDEAVSRSEEEPDTDISRDTDNMGYAENQGAYWANPFVKEAP